MADENAVAQPTPEVIKPQMKKAPRALLEILVHGKEEDKAKVKKMTTALQEQLSPPKIAKRARVFWMIDKGETTAEEKKKWLIENVNAKYYVFAPDDYKVEKDFIKKALTRIQVFENALQSIKSAGVFVSKNKPEPVQEAVEVKDETKTEPK